MEFTNPQVLIDHILLDKSNGNFENAFNSLVKLFELEPHLFTQPSTWSTLINQPTVFGSLVAHEDNILFVINVMKLLENIYLDGHLVEGVKFIDSFLQGAHFRLTAHSQGNLKPLMAMRASLIQKSSYTLEDPDFKFKTSVRCTDHPRIGILFRHLKSDPETTSLLPFINQAKKDGIELFIFTLSNEPLDSFGKIMLSYADEIVYLSQNLADNIQIIRSFDLDLFIYGNDITAKLSMGACLSFHRVARKAATTVSTLTTTASPFVDIYFGCEFHAMRGAKDEFTEKFILLPNPGFAFSFSNQPPFTNHLSLRQELNIPDDVILFISGANQTKLHIPVLETWASILSSVPQSVLILYPFPPHFGAASNPVITRINNYFIDCGISVDRIVILSQLPGREAVKWVLRQADIGLDSFPYPGVTTIVDAVEAGLPTVTLAGNSLRSSQAAAILSCINMDELVTHSLEQYVNLSVYLARDFAYRKSVASRVAAAFENKPAFLDPTSFGKAVNEIFFQIHSELKAMES